MKDLNSRLENLNLKISKENIEILTKAYQEISLMLLEEATQHKTDLETRHKKLSKNGLSDLKESEDLLEKLILKKSRWLIASTVGTLVLICGIMLGSYLTIHTASKTLLMKQTELNEISQKIQTQQQTLNVLTDQTKGISAFYNQRGQLILTLPMGMKMHRNVNPRNALQLRQKKLNQWKAY